MRESADVARAERLARLQATKLFMENGQVAGIERVLDKGLFSGVAARQVLVELGLHFVDSVGKKGLDLGFDGGDIIWGR